MQKLGITGIECQNAYNAFNFDFNLLHIHVIFIVSIPSRLKIF